MPIFGDEGLNIAPSGFTPTQLAGLQLWFKADTIGLADGAAIGSWSDSSGNGFNIQQTDATKKPTYKTNIINSLPVVRFDGSHFFEDNTTWTNGGSANISIFAVAAYSSGTDYARLFNNENNFLFGSQNGVYLDGYGNGAGWGNALATTGSSMTAGTFYILESINNSSGTSLSSYKANTLLENGINNPMTAFTDGFNIGTKHTQAGNGAFQTWIGDLAELIVYNSAVSSTNRTNIRGYLVTRYGLT